MIIKNIFNFKFSNEKKINKKSVKLYSILVEHARKEEFYIYAGIPDSLDGRFENILLHYFFLYYGFRKVGLKNSEVLKSVLDIMFNDFDSNLRELGVGDLKIGKKIYQMTEAYRGRIKAYDFAANKGDEEIGNVLKRNLYGTVPIIKEQLVNQMVRYFKDSLNVNKFLALYKVFVI